MNRSIEDLCTKFRALCDPTRLSIFQLLRQYAAGVSIDDDGAVQAFTGTTVGEVCCRVDVAQSTVSHHLKELRQAGLIRTHRRGRSTVCYVEPAALEVIRAFAEDEGRKQ